MTTAIFTMLAIALGYVIGLLQGGIHIHMNKKPVAPVTKKDEEPQYNEEFSHLLPPEMQEYIHKTGGFIK